MHQLTVYRAAMFKAEEPGKAINWKGKTELNCLRCQSMNSMKIIIPLHFYFMKKDSKRCCDTTTPESIHTKDESKRGSAFAFIFGVN